LIFSGHYKPGTGVVANAVGANSELFSQLVNPHRRLLTEYCDANTVDHLSSLHLMQINLPRLT